MEEKIKRLNEIISLCKEELENSDDNTFATMDIHDIQALSDLIDDYKRIYDENVEFRARYLIELNRQEYLYIPKSRIESKIKVLEILQKEFPNNEELRIKIIAYKELLGE